MSWIGWVSGKEENESRILALGVTLGERVGDTWENCCVPDDKMYEFEVLWGGLVWCLEHKKD